VYGFLEVNKVAGNFHFAPGKSFQQSGVHVHDLLAFQKDSFNVRDYLLFCIPIANFYCNLYYTFYILYEISKATIYNTVIFWQKNFFSLLFSRH